jgi:hypothetical protein
MIQTVNFFRFNKNYFREKFIVPPQSSYEFDLKKFIKCKKIVLSLNFTTKASFNVINVSDEVYKITNICYYQIEVNCNVQYIKLPEDGKIKETNTKMMKNDDKNNKNQSIYESIVKKPLKNNDKKTQLFTFFQNDRFVIFDSNVKMIKPKNFNCFEKFHEYIYIPNVINKNHFKFEKLEICSDRLSDKDKLNNVTNNKSVDTSDVNLKNVENNINLVSDIKPTDIKDDKKPVINVTNKNKGKRNKHRRKNKKKNNNTNKNDNNDNNSNNNDKEIKNDVNVNQSMNDSNGKFEIERLKNKLFHLQQESNDYLLTSEKIEELEEKMREVKLKIYELETVGYEDNEGILFS